MSIARRNISMCVLTRGCSKAETCLAKIEEWERNGCPHPWHAWHEFKTFTGCEAALNPRLIPYEGHRIEVTYADGEKTRFWVSRSTGLQPCHLEIKRRGSSGGTSAYLPDDATFVAVRGPERKERWR